MLTVWRTLSHQVTTHCRVFLHTVCTYYLLQGLPPYSLHILLITGSSSIQLVHPTIAGSSSIHFAHPTYYRVFLHTVCTSYYCRVFLHTFCTSYLLQGLTPLYYFVLSEMNLISETDNDKRTCLHAAACGGYECTT